MHELGGIEPLLDSIGASEQEKDDVADYAREHASNFFDKMKQIYDNNFLANDEFIHRIFNKGVFEDESSILLRELDEFAEFYEKIRYKEKFKQQIMYEFKQFLSKRFGYVNVTALNYLKNNILDEDDHKEIAEIILEKEKISYEQENILVNIISTDVLNEFEDTIKKRSMELQLNIFEKIIQNRKYILFSKETIHELV
jgi:hypothetical protein